MILFLECLPVCHPSHNLLKKSKVLHCWLSRHKKLIWDFRVDWVGCKWTSLVITIEGSLFDSCSICVECCLIASHKETALVWSNNRHLNILNGSYSFHTTFLWFLCFQFLQMLKLFPHTWCMFLCTLQKFWFSKIFFIIGKNLHFYSARMCKIKQNWQ